MKRIFLLGGHDLEMLTIRELLDEAGEVFYDAFEQKLEYEKKLWNKLLKDTPSDDLEKKFNDLKSQFEKLKDEYPKLRLDVDVH